MAPAPRLGALAVVLSDTHALLVRRGKDPDRGLWGCPGGHVEPGETLLQAVVRETLEETAWTLRPLALLGVYRWQPPTARRPTLRFAFVGETTAHDPLRRLDQGILAAHWMTRTELVAAAGQLRSPLVLHCIDDFLAGQRRPLEPFAALDLDTAASAPALTIA